MTGLMLTAALGFALLCVMLALIFCGIRLLLGPTAQDRVLALDSLSMAAMLFILLLGIRFSSVVYFEAAPLVALIGFVSSMVLANFLIGGELIEWPVSPPGACPVCVPGWPCPSPGSCRSTDGSP